MSALRCMGVTIPSEYGLFSDISCLLQMRAPSSKACMAGKWNIDKLVNFCIYHDFAKDRWG